jgi:23S rRNA-/tRNA-specific pseudouridylate synthase
MREVVVTEHEAGLRLDRLVRKLLPGTPLGAIFRLLRSGGIRVDDRKAKGDLRLVAGMRLQLRVADADFAPAPVARRTPAAARPPTPARRPAEPVPAQRLPGRPGQSPRRRRPRRY